MSRRQRCAAYRWRGLRRCARDRQRGQGRRLLDDILDAYISGLADEDPHVDREAARLGAIGNLVIRSAFTALPVELLDAPATRDLAGLFDRRARYARFLVDLAAEVAI